MRYLLDTHVVLWIAENSPMLSDAAKAAILNPTSENHVSIVSAWEVAIKLGTQKLRFIGGLPEFYRILDANGFFTLSVEREYLLQLSNLPEHHRDPFDRLLVATAIVEEMAIITIDENIRKYSASTLW
jgi:PIN domain nuclease of toxin-antitoxin system